MRKLPTAISVAALQVRQIPMAPPSFRGTISEFIEDVLDPILPAASEVERFHEAIADYIQQPSATFLVRAVVGLERGTTVATHDDVQLKPTDNSPAWWWHAILFNSVPIERAVFADVIAATPCHMFEIPQIPTVNRAGWHVAHVLQAKDGDTNWRDWSRASIVRRFIRNIHPCNVFYVPGVKSMRVGADERLIARVGAHYRERYASIWSEFADLAEAPTGFGATPPKGPLVIEPRSPGGSRPASAPVVRPKRPAVARRPFTTGAPVFNLWPSILRVGRPLAVGELLALHPAAATLTRSLVDELTTERVISIADALHNKCRVRDMQAAAPGDPVRQSELAWQALLSGAQKIHNRPSGWTGAAKLLNLGEREGLAAVALLDIQGIARVGANLVYGPYGRAIRLGIR